MSQEQFEHLNDYSNLSSLHLYGDVLDLYNLELQATLGTAGQIFEDLKRLDKGLFNTYVAFILAKAGYDIEAPELWEDSSKIELEDWHRACDYLADFLFETGSQDVWGETYKRGKERIHVTFLDTFYTTEFSDITKRLDRESTNLVIVHPRTARQVKNEFYRLRRECEAYGDTVRVISTGELLQRLISDERRQKLVENEWELIREQVLSDLTKSWPVIAVQRHRKLYDESKKLLAQARAKLDMDQCRDSVRDAGLACEGFLKIMTSMFEPDKLKDRPEFSDMIQILGRYIPPELGEDTLDDLELIRQWRNRASHVEYAPPDYADAMKVVMKTELFVRLFEMKIMTRGRRH